MRDIAIKCKDWVARDGLISQFFFDIYKQAVESLKKTPQMLDKLKEAGFVDAGGCGFVYFLEGFIKWLNKDDFSAIFSHNDLGNFENTEISLINETGVNPGDFCVKILLKNPSIEKSELFNKLYTQGDSLIICDFKDTFNIHIHTKDPGKTKVFLSQFGEIEQFFVDQIEISKFFKGNKSVDTSIGIIAIADCPGFNEILLELGADIVIYDNKPIKPSINEIINSINELQKNEIIILQSDKDNRIIIEEAIKHTNKKVKIVHTENIPSSIRALIQFNPDYDIGYNVEIMEKAGKETIVGYIGQSIRNLPGEKVRTGDYFAIFENKIISSDKSIDKVLNILIEKVISKQVSLITIYYGKNISFEKVNELIKEIINNYPEIEIDSRWIGHPLYDIIIQAEI